MDSLYDQLSFDCSKRVTNTYSTSFAMATGLLEPEVRTSIHSIYGFVRLADEIVDTFHDWNKEFLLNKFEEDFHCALKMGISLNPILNSFQQTIRKYNVDLDLVDAFLKSMKMDLVKSDYTTAAEYEDYIYGSADVVGLMCLKVFVNGDEIKFNELKASAMRLGSAFQKVNFLRDLKSDVELLNRSYFPGVDLRNLTNESKRQIIEEIEEDFKAALSGIRNLPRGSRFGVYTACVYYKQLLKKLKKTPSPKIMETRIRVTNPVKIVLLIRSYFNVKLNLIS